MRSTTPFTGGAWSSPRDWPPMTPRSLWVSRANPAGCVSSVAAIALTAVFFALALIGMWATLYRK